MPTLVQHSTLLLFNHTNQVANNNCYLEPALSMNIISGSCLLRDEYSFKFENNGCSIYTSNIFYGHGPNVNGLFLLNLDSSDTHVHNTNAKKMQSE